MKLWNCRIVCKILHIVSVVGKIIMRGRSVWAFKVQRGPDLLVYTSLSVALQQIQNIAARYVTLA